MAEQADIAAAPATEANLQTTNTTEVTTPATPAAPATPATPVANIPADQIEAFNRFVESNGGYEKAFSKLKTAISTPAQKTEPAQPAQPTQPVQSAQPAQPQAPARPGEGYLSSSDIVVLQYNNMLANTKEYENIKDYVANGEYITEMTNMGMNAVDAYGNLNNKAIRMFLDLKSKTMPAIAPAEPVSSPAPTVQFANVGEEVTSMEDAMTVLGQNGHPLHDSAIKFMRGQIFKK